MGVGKAQRFPGQHSPHPEMPHPDAQNQGRESEDHHHLLAPCQKEHPVRIIRPRDDASACDTLSTIFLSGFNSLPYHPLASTASR